jgi:hypothetical protein
MTEADWDSSIDTRAMLAFMRASGKLSDRKARLFAVACCRRVSELAGLPELAVAERAADGLAGDDELADACAEAMRGYEQLAGQYSYVPAPQALLAREGALVGVTLPRPTEAAEAASRNAALFAGDGEAAEQAALLRDLFGNPFRPLSPLAPFVLQWSQGLVRRLAEQAYEHRLLPSGWLDPERLVVLADALEEAGADAELVGHLRRPEEHVRGCQVVDLALART